MPVTGKRFRAALEKVDRAKLHDPGEAVGAVKSAATAKFDKHLLFRFRYRLSKLFIKIDI